MGSEFIVRVNSHVTKQPPIGNEAGRAAKREDRIRRWADRYARGLCVYCGDNPHKENQRGCIDCAGKHTRTQCEFAKKRKDRVVLYSKRIRQKAVEKYGGSCECCDEDELLFLTIDHTNGDGCLDRAKGLTGTAFFMYLLREPIRSDLRVLCYNCNMGRETGGGVCPHMRGKTDLNTVDLRTIKRLNIGNKVDWPEDEALLKEYKEHGSRHIATRLSVSLSAPLKRLQRRGLVSVNHRPI